LTNLTLISSGEFFNFRTSRGRRTEHSADCIAVPLPQQHSVNIQAAIIVTPHSVKFFTIHHDVYLDIEK